MSYIREIHNHNEVKKATVKCTPVDYVNIDNYFKICINISYKTCICFLGRSMCLSLHTLRIEHRHIVQPGLVGVNAYVAYQWRCT